MENKAVPLPPAQEEHSSFSQAATNLAIEYVHGQTEHSIIIWVRAEGCEAEVGYQSVKKQPTKKADFITSVHKTTYLFVMWAAVCINVIQMLLQVPVCRRGMNLLFMKYAFLTTVVKRGLKKKL